MLLNINSSLSQPFPSFLTTVNPVKLRCLLAPLSLSLDYTTVVLFRFPFTDLLCLVFAVNYGSAWQP